MGKTIGKSDKEIYIFKLREHRKEINKYIQHLGKMYIYLIKKTKWK